MDAINRRWAALRGEYRVVIVAALATAVIGLAFDAPGRVLDNFSPDPPPSEILQIVSLDVAGGDAEAKEPQVIDLTVRNVGETVSVITDVELVVRDVVELVSCETGGSLEASRVYAPVELPTMPVDGETVEVRVSQQIAPDEADRFSLQLTIPATDYLRVTRLYELGVTVFHDAAPTGVPAGIALVSLPYVPTTMPNCGTEYWAAFRDFLARSGERSASFTLPEAPNPPPTRSVGERFGTLDEFSAFLKQQGLTCSQSVTNLQCVSDSGPGYLVDAFVNDDTAFVDNVFVGTKRPANGAPELIVGLAGFAFGSDAASWVASNVPEAGGDQLEHCVKRAKATLVSSRDDKGLWDFEIWQFEDGC